MNATDAKILQIMLDARLIDEVQRRSLLANQAQWGGKIHHLAIEMGVVKDGVVADAMARALNLPRLNLATIPIEPQALSLLDHAFCAERVVLPCAIRDDGKTLWVAASDPMDIQTIDDIRVRSGMRRVNAGVAGYKEILGVAKRVYAGGSAAHEESIALEDGSPDEEFKVTDVSGRTSVKHIRDIVGAEGAAMLQGGRAAPAPPPAPAPRPAPRAVAQPQQAWTGLTGGVQTSAVAAAMAGQTGATPDVLEAIRQIHATQSQTNKVLRAIIELCIQRGIFTADEYRALVER